MTVHSHLLSEFISVLLPTQIVLLVPIWLRPPIELLFVDLALLTVSAPPQIAMAVCVSKVTIEISWRLFMSPAQVSLTVTRL